MSMDAMMIKRKDRRQTWGRRRQGQAIVEMALVMTLLLVLTFGIADMGYFMYRYVQAANCVRETARRVVVHADLSEDNYCVDGSLRDEVEVTYGTDANGDELATASLSIDHQWIAIGYLIPGLGTTMPINTQETMRVEGQIIP